MAFDSIPFTHFMMATRGHKTGKNDDGYGNGIGRRQTDIYQLINSEYFSVSLASL